MIRLPNGCSCSDPKVYPLTWSRLNSSIKKDWYIHYRFYDPTFKEKYPEGCLKIVKGMNCFKDLADRQAATKSLLENELTLLKERGYNPITRQMEEPIEVQYLIHPDAPMIEAMSASAKRLILESETKKDLRSVMKYFTEAAAQLRLSSMPIKDVRRRHIKMILEQIGANKGAKWTNNTFNWYRAYLRMVFVELVELESIELNPINDLKKKKATQKIRVLLTDEQRTTIDNDLRERNYRFWRLMHIFFHSGSRNTEILKVKKEDVDMNRQLVKYTVRKGRVVREVERPIKDSVLHLWEQVALEAKPGQYLFSEGLKPGNRSIRTEQLTRRWRCWVKKKYNIDADWYSLKHLNTDEMSALYGTELPAHLNQHSEAMTIKHYAVNQKARNNELIKKAPNTFMPLKKPA